METVLASPGKAFVTIIISSLVHLALRALLSWACLLVHKFLTCHVQHLLVVRNLLLRAMKFQTITDAERATNVLMLREMLRKLGGGRALSLYS